MPIGIYTRTKEHNKKVAKEKHHEDYSKPLEIKFVCILCHNRIHKR